MGGNRRDFIKAGASIGLLGVSEAPTRAQQQYPRPLTSGSTYIGVATSINVSANSQNAFIQGYTDAKGPPMGQNPQYLPDTPDASYHKRKIVRAVKKFYDDSSCKLIVTVGGFVTFAAANQFFTDDRTAKGWLSLVGNTAIPDDTNTVYWGCVSVKSYDLNSQRIAWLVNDLKVASDSTDVTLLINLNSEQRTREEVNWIGMTNPGPIVICGNNSSSGENDNSIFDDAFKKVTTKGVVASSDPFFQHSKNSFVTAANKWLQADTTRFICYPLWDFQDSAPGPRATQSGVFGPYLANDISGNRKSAYYKLGFQAGTALKNISSAGVVDADWDKKVL
jgi:hypothetical protein